MTKFYEKWISDDYDIAEIRSVIFGWQWRWTTGSWKRWHFTWKYETAERALLALPPFKGRSEYEIRPE